MGSVIKKRRKRMSKKKHRKMLRKTRHQRKESFACKSAHKAPRPCRPRGIYILVPAGGSELDMTAPADSDGGGCRRRD